MTARAGGERPGTQRREKKPVCPHCEGEMGRVKYRGYYESFVYWECDCEAFPEYDGEWRGGYA